MKIKPISPRKATRILNEITVKKPSEIKLPAEEKLFTPGYDARRNLERYAEEMSPQDYIRAKNYLAGIEYSEMLRGSKI